MPSTGIAEAAVADLEREIRIKATADAAQAKAELGSLNESIGLTVQQQVGQRIAQESLTGAITDGALAEARATKVETDHAAAIYELNLAHQNAKAAVAAMGDAAALSGAKYKLAIDEAAASLVRLEILQAAMKAAGGPITPRMILDIQTMDSSIKAATLSQVGGAAATRAFSMEAGLLRGNVLGAANALRLAATSGSGMAAALGAAVLPIGAVLGLMALIPMIVEKINDKTKEWSLGLVDMINGFDDEGIALKKAGESYEDYQARIEKIKNAREDFTRALIAQGAGILQEEKDVGRATVAWQGHLAAMTGVFEVYPEFLKATKVMGISFRSTFDEMRHEAQTFVQSYNLTLKRDGVQGAHAWLEANKGVLSKIISYYQEAGKEVPAALAKMRAGMDEFKTSAETAALKHKELKEKLLDVMGAGLALREEIAKGAETYKSEGAAVLGLKNVIIDHIKQLTSLKGLEGDAEHARVESLKTWTELANKYGINVGKLNDLAVASAKLKKETEDLGKKLEDNAHQFETVITKIEEHRRALLDDADKTTKKVVDGIFAQQKALKTQYTEGIIDGNEYNKEYNRLQGERVDAQRKAEQQSAAINKDQDKLKDEEVKKDTETKTALEKNLKERGIAATVAKGLYDDLVKSEEANVKALQAEEIVHGTIAAKVDHHAERQRDFARDMKDSKTKTLETTTALEVDLSRGLKAAGADADLTRGKIDALTSSLLLLRAAAEGAAGTTTTNATGGQSAPANTSEG
jgi:hypothetical protein